MRQHEPRARARLSARLNVTACRAEVGACRRGGVSMCDGRGGGKWVGAQVLESFTGGSRATAPSFLLVKNRGPPGMLIELPRQCTHPLSHHGEWRGSRGGAPEHPGRQGGCYLSRP